MNEGYQKIAELMKANKIKDTNVKHLLDDDGKPLICEGCSKPLTEVTIIFESGEMKTHQKGCICDRIKEVNDKQREINAKTFDKGSIIHGKYNDKSLDDYQTETDQHEHAVIVAKHYINHFDEHMKNGQNIFIQGTMGTGKTHLAAAIRNALSDKHYRVLFITLPDYMDKVKQEFDEKRNGGIKGGGQSRQIYKMAQDADLLILDDVGANRMTTFEISELFRIVEARTDKCTIYTTNYNKSDFTATREINRVFSRMMQNTKLVVINGSDNRLKGMTF